MLWPKLDSYLYAFCVNKVRSEYAGLLAQSRSAAAFPDAGMTSTPASSEALSP
jgi:hypothetical protein